MEALLEPDIVEKVASFKLLLSRGQVLTGS